MIRLLNANAEDWYRDISSRIFTGEEFLKAGGVPPKRGTPTDDTDFGGASDFGGPWCQNPASRGPGPFPHKSFFGAEIWNRNRAAKRPRFCSRSEPQRRICVQTGQDPPKTGLGTRDPQNLTLLQNRSHPWGSLFLGVPFGAPRCRCHVAAPRCCTAQRCSGISAAVWRPFTIGVP